MMKNIDKRLAKDLIKEINLLATKEMNIMEVCGTHTHMISKLGLKSILSPNIKLISGPGCPVCVTSEDYIDNAIEMLNTYDIIMTTFGDMMRLRGTEKSLLEEKSKGKDVRIVYSPFDLVEIAEANRNKNVVFLAVGFETTAPIIALVIKTAAEKGIDNLLFITSIKLMPPIINYILKQPNNKINGLICPGHVATIKGADYFRFIELEYKIPAAICGFEATDILIGIHFLVNAIAYEQRASFENLYKRCVKSNGNLIANQVIEEVFDISDTEWRGIGKIANSSLTINEKFSRYDALKTLPVNNRLAKANTGCECKDILLGNKKPYECRFFGKQCNPINSLGPCMVSSEGACAITYRYGDEM